MLYILETKDNHTINDCEKVAMQALDNLDEPFIFYAVQVESKIIDKLVRYQYEIEQLNNAVAYPYPTIVIEACKLRLKTLNLEYNSLINGCKAQSLATK